MIPQTVFWLRHAARYAVMTALPASVGGRDRLTYYDLEKPLRPEEGLTAFLHEMIRDQGMEESAQGIRAFLDFWLPRQGLAPLGLALIEFSFTTDTPGFGLMLYGDNHSMTRAFRQWSRLDGIDAETTNRCAALCEAFHDSDMATVRAEFRPEAPTRLSISSSWSIDPLRLSPGLAARLRRVPAAYRNKALEARARALEEAFAPEFFPLFLGLSYDGGVLEPKAYFVRHVNEPPLGDTSRATRLLETLAMSDADFAQVRSIYRALWTASSEPMVQVMVSVSADAAAPLRMNLITAGTMTGAVKDALRAIGDPRFNVRSVESFERLLRTGRAKYVALRVTPEGLSPRVKLYGHAWFGILS